ncbi:MAG: peptide deformylase [Ferrovum sp. 37-45-19]|jgi:peptide deformylase|nr:MAG: peptide deformylase [Ferrovum sp. 37-45-19]OZB34495.1 MAG: peptide deformylase [Ferrovum sp. 34-44-207]HQT82240.1 peptide deformylase [Ferrovaceae bacterium]
MALLQILHYPDERLHTIAKVVSKVDQRIKTLVQDMAETMRAAPGIGLAATQVNVHERVIVLDISPEQNQLQVFINPVIIQKEGEAINEEGCLSVPGIYDKVTRARKIKIQALNEMGESFELEAEGLLAVCIQHEMDHLEGKVFVEYLSLLKQNRIKTKLKKRIRETL